MIKLLLGGSPCTHWSVAQKNNRETEAEGIGWELFKNYLIAKEKFQPNFFLYENNKSAAPAIKDQIAKELGVPLQYINSALVCAQNRERFYCHNMGKVKQPKDRGILLRDILGLKENDNCLCVAQRGRYISNGIGTKQVYEFRANQKTNTLTTVSKDNLIFESIRIGDFPNKEGNVSGSQATRIYSINGKSIKLIANGGGQGAKTGLYAFPIEFKNNIPTKVITLSNNKIYTVYYVKNHDVEINEKKYSLKVDDGYYIIRSLTVQECCRLQTMPDDYCRAVSASQGYKGLGNGWTAEVIIYLLQHMNVPLDEEIVVLSMYDGIGTGRYCLNKMGYKNVKYYATEIDKYAMQVSMSNYPDIIQLGDAFQVREGNFLPNKKRGNPLK